MDVLRRSVLLGNGPAHRDHPPALRFSVPDDDWQLAADTIGNGFGGGVLVTSATTSPAGSSERMDAIDEFFL